MTKKSGFILPCFLFMLTLHPNHQKYNMPQTLHIAIIGGGAAGFFAGEVLDIDAITGGFNLQAAWTTGYVVGQHIGE